MQMKGSKLQVLLERILPAGSLAPYNGNGGLLYSSTALSGIIPDQQNGYGTLFFAIAGLQNGAPDGIALIKPDNSVVMFLSYEGSFTATDGLAIGLTSTDIGVLEVGTEALGLSLQLSGAGDYTTIFPGNYQQQQQKMTLIIIRYLVHRSLLMKFITIIPVQMQMRGSKSQVLREQILPAGLWHHTMGMGDCYIPPQPSVA